MEKSEVSQQPETLSPEELAEQQETIAALQELYNNPNNKAKKRIKKLEAKMLNIRLKNGFKGKDFSVPLNRGGNLRMHQTHSGTLYLRDKNGSLHRLSEEMFEQIKEELASSSPAPRPIGLLSTDTSIGLPSTPNS